MNQNPSSECRLVLTTCANRAEAETIARALVEERLVACVNIMEGVLSIYRWHDRIESSSEVLLLMKTIAQKIKLTEARMQELHSYALPEFVVIDISAGSNSYLSWIAEEVR